MLMGTKLGWTALRGVRIAVMLLLLSKTEGAPATGSNKIVFHQNQTRFVDVFADCMHDENCHILYHHVQKTGGTFLSSIFYPLFNKNETYRENYELACCFNDLMQRFEGNVPKHCDQMLGIFEVSGSQFDKVVTKCNEYYAGKGHRAVALVTTREPVDRLVSHINMDCNRGTMWQSSIYKEACQECSYHNRTAFWDTKVQMSYDIYMQVLLYAERLPVNLLVLDRSWLSAFQYKVRSHLDNSQTFSVGESNRATRNSVCDFTVPQAMRMKMEPSRLAYEALLQ